MRSSSGLNIKKVDIQLVRYKIVQEATSAKDRSIDQSCRFHATF